METKSLWQILKGTLLGTDSEGSAKRATSFFFVIILLTSLTLVYEYCFYISIIAKEPTAVQTMVVKMYEAIHFSLQLSIWVFLGLATIESVTNLWKTIKGNNTEAK